MSDANSFGCQTRRSILNGLAVLGAGILINEGQSVAQPGANPRRLDVHHHFTPNAYLEFLKAHNQGGGGGRGGGRGGALGSAFANWTLAEDLDDMDKNGTATALLSITTPGFWFGEKNEARKVARECNESAAKLSADPAGRFGSFATLPLTDTAVSLRELE